MKTRLLKLYSFTPMLLAFAFFLSPQISFAEHENHDQNDVPSDRYHNASGLSRQNLKRHGIRPAIINGQLKFPNSKTYRACLESRLFDQMNVEQVDDTTGNKILFQVSLTEKCMRFDGKKYVIDYSKLSPEERKPENKIWISKSNAYSPINIDPEIKAEVCLVFYKDGDPDMDLLEERTDKTACIGKTPALVAHEKLLAKQAELKRLQELSEAREQEQEDLRHAGAISDACSAQTHENAVSALRYLEYNFGANVEDVIAELNKDWIESLKKQMARAKTVEEANEIAKKFNEIEDSAKESDDDSIVIDFEVAYIEKRLKLVEKKIGFGDDSVDVKTSKSDVAEVVTELEAIKAIVDESTLALSAESDEEHRNKRDDLLERIGDSYRNKAAQLRKKGLKKKNADMIARAETLAKDGMAADNRNRSKWIGYLEKVKIDEYKACVGKKQKKGKLYDISKIMESCKEIREEAMAYGERAIERFDEESNEYYERKSEHYQMYGLNELFGQSPGQLDYFARDAWMKHYMSFQKYQFEQRRQWMQRMRGGHGMNMFGAGMPPHMMMGMNTGMGPF